MFLVYKEKKEKYYVNKEIVYVIINQAMLCRAIEFSSYKTMTND